MEITSSGNRVSRIPKPEVPTHKARITWTNTRLDHNDIFGSEKVAHSRPQPFVRDDGRRGIFLICQEILVGCSDIFCFDLMTDFRHVDAIDELPEDYMY